MRHHHPLLITLWLAALAVSPGSAGAGPAEDAYIRGYAAAILERELHVSGHDVHVADGVIRLRTDRLGAAGRDRVVSSLRAIPGVARVELVEPPVAATLTTTTAETPAASAATPAASAPAASPATTATPATVAAPTSSAQATAGREADGLLDRPLRQTGPLPTGFLPSGLLFDPLLADPRWPNFSASYHRYLGDPDFKNVSAVSFGETFPFYRGQAPFDGQWEIGLQASVFAFFDLDSSSFDLINADYFVGAPLTYRRGPLAAMVRLSHQSSHLGDEFLLRGTGVRRRNLSYENVDGKLSYDLFGGLLRPYAGAGYLIDSGQDSVEGWTAQYGFEVLSPWALKRPSIRPVFAADFQHRETHGSGPDISLRAGVQFESVQVLGRKLLILLEYFNGHSPNGQFADRKIEYVGIGAHFYH